MQPTNPLITRLTLADQPLAQAGCVALNSIHSLPLFILHLPDGGRQIWLVCDATQIVLLHKSASLLLWLTQQCLSLRWPEETERIKNTHPTIRHNPVLMFGTQIDKFICLGLLSFEKGSILNRWLA